ncbi:HEL213Wp [Eremothecium sinecaudum]|uniref:HEL213Wp n=1 Tax=Eremothecium sinecaudum TaxID=45286 RepID=A0A0X8HTD9_9SACH|nr:HEL213Wp [Eremothecium sinecaudum]AMD21068.1 HEL213Wp [Eremothecium sinecaudum]
MNALDVSELLSLIDNGVKDLASSERTIQAINEFQSDPLVLDNRLPDYIADLTRGVLEKSSEEQYAISEIFYNFCKVCTWKKVRRQLNPDIYHLPTVLGLLKEEHNSEKHWKFHYLCLIWLSLLSMSPFKLENGPEVYEVANTFQSSPLFKPVISSIHSELFIRNKELFWEHLAAGDIEITALRMMLKHLAASSLQVQIEFITEEFLNEIVHKVVNEHFDTEEQGIEVIKMLPKLCHLQLGRGNWDSVEELISFFFMHIGRPFTEFRYKLARNLGKIVNSINKYDPNLSLELVESVLNDTVELIDNQASDAIDIDMLHSYLLILAELARFKLLQKEHLQLINDKVIPRTISFQQLRMSSIMGQRIRDATNYICWSIARNVTDIPHDINRSLTFSLLMNSMTDYDHVIRRSSSAALQELIGRHGFRIMNHAIIVKIVELPVSNLSNCFEENLINIINGFGAEPECIGFILDWLLNITILQNYHIPTVKHACKTFSKVYTHKGEYKDIVKKRILDFGIRAKVDAFNGSKFIYLFNTLPVEVQEKEGLTLSVQCFGRLLENKVTATGSAIQEFKILCYLKFVAQYPDYVFDEEAVTYLFQLIRIIQDTDQDFEEIGKLYNTLIAAASAKGDTMFKDASSKSLFWETFYKFVRFNNTLSCSALPNVSPSMFKQCFYQLVPSMDCNSKATLIDTVREDISKVKSMDLLYDILDLLDDYTITERGDVGRIVRTSVARLIQKHLSQFTTDPKMKEKCSNKLLRLIGETQDELKQLSFTILKTMYNTSYDDDLGSFNANILQFYHSNFKGNREFWKGYIMSAGAIHSTDKQITSAIDEFLRYYATLTEEEQLELTNELIRIVPSAKELQDIKANGIKQSILGGTSREITKQTITMVTFWHRIFESGIKIHPQFNFKGVFAKFYNLQLSKQSSSLRLAIIRIFPLLSSSHSLNTKDRVASIEFTNTVLKTLWKMTTAIKTPGALSTLQCTALNSIAVILLEHEKAELAKKLLSNTVGTKPDLNGLEVKELLIA